MAIGRIIAQELDPSKTDIMQNVEQQTTAQGGAGTTDATQADAGAAAPAPTVGEEESGATAPARPAPGPAPGPVPSIPVPPPPVQFNIGGSGGGETASSFARPGSAAARPFRSMNFVNSRLGGGSPLDMGRRVGFGAGAASVGGGAIPGAGAPEIIGGQGGWGEANAGDDELARLLASIAGRYQGGA